MSQILLGKTVILTPSFPAPRSHARPERERQGSPETGMYDPVALLEAVIPLLPHLLSFFRSVFCSLSLKQVNCQAVVGLGGPAETGMLYGYFWALKSILRVSDRVHLEMIPDFTRERLEGHLEADIHVRYPFVLIARLLRLFIQWKVVYPAGTTTGGVPG